MVGTLPFEHEWFQSYSDMMTRMRMGLAVLIALFVVLIDPSPERMVVGICGAFVYLTYVVLLLRFPRMRYILLAINAYILMLGDVAFFTFLILQCEHPQGWGLIFYLAPTLSMAIRSGWKAGLVVGTLCFLGHTLAVWGFFRCLPDPVLVYVAFCCVLLVACCGFLSYTERERAIHYAVTDGLTNLYNYRFFQQMLAHALKLADRSQLTVTLLLLDVDDFKRINDTYGHVAGDCALQHIAGVIRQSVRGTDIIARYGGEEFAVILIDCDLDYGREIGQRICSTLEYCPCETDKHEIHLSVSIGAACYPTQATDQTQLVDLADQALYYAKRNGKNRIALYGRDVISASTGPLPQ